jgi:hypothetical protein
MRALAPFLVRRTLLSPSGDTRRRLAIMPARRERSRFRFRFLCNARAVAVGAGVLLRAKRSTAIDCALRLRAGDLPQPLSKL